MPGIQQGLNKSSAAIVTIPFKFQERGPIKMFHRETCLLCLGKAQNIVLKKIFFNVYFSKYFKAADRMLLNGIGKEKIFLAVKSASLRGAFSPKGENNCI